ASNMGDTALSLFLAAADMSRAGRHASRVAHNRITFMNPDLQKRFPQAAYIDPSARVTGKVEMAEKSSLWPCAFIRAESRHVSIGCCTNLQDHVMVHVGYHHP